MSKMEYNARDRVYWRDVIGNSIFQFLRSEIEFRSCFVCGRDPIECDFYEKMSPIIKLDSICFFLF